MTETTVRERLAHPIQHDAFRDRVDSALLRWAGPAIPVLVLAIMGYRQRWVTEDAFISLRVVENVLAGNGPVFNRGERVEAYTHPLWIAILSGWGALGLPTAKGAVILGFMLSLTGLIAAMAAASRLADPLVVLSRSEEHPLARLHVSLTRRGPSLWFRTTGGSPSLFHSAR